MRKKLFVSIAAMATVISVFAAAGGAAAPQKLSGWKAAGTHDHEPSSAPGNLARKLARARLATAKYALDLEAAKADGYFIITPMMPDMGYHFLNPDNLAEFDVTRPPILVYVRRGDSWQLVAFEWVFGEKPAKDPLPGAQYGSFGAACHYEDGTFVFKESQEECPETSPETGAAFVFWHPRLVTLHVWAWYPNPVGLYNGTNPFIRPFNE
jgi:hypothetical protein